MKVLETLRQNEAAFISGAACAPEPLTLLTLTNVFLADIKYSTESSRQEKEKNTLQWFLDFLKEANVLENVKLVLL